MIRHVVAFDFKPEANAERIEQIATELRDLAKTIPAIKAYSCGPDEGITPGNVDLAVVADFDDEEGFISYRDHPQHKEIIARLIAPVIAQRSAVQFKVLSRPWFPVSAAQARPARDPTREPVAPKRRHGLFVRTGP